MTAKPVIEIYKKKSAEELAMILSEADSRLETGSAAAITAASAAALLLRAAAITMAESPENEKVQYIHKNAGILRDYMVHLIDEDVRCRAPLKRAMKEGGEREIEAARHPAAAICGEIINMMSKCIELCRELSELCPKNALHYIGESAALAVSAMKCARFYAVDMAGKCSDDTYKFIVRRENEITAAEYEPMANALEEKILREI